MATVDPLLVVGFLLYAFGLLTMYYCVKDD